MRYASHGNGHEASSILKIATEAIEHWSQRVEPLIDAADSEDNMSYEHLLPKPSYSVKIRCIAAGKLPPRQFTMDE